MDCSPPGFSVHGDSSSKNTGVGCHALLQGIFLTQGSNPRLLHCRWILYHLGHQGSPVKRAACSLAHIVAETCWYSPGADVTVNDFSAFLDMRRCKNWAHKTISWKYLSTGLFCQFFPKHRVPHSLSPPELLAGVLKVSDCSSSWFNHCTGRWQLPIFSWHKFRFGASYKAARALHPH